MTATPLSDFCPVCNSYMGADAEVCPVCGTPRQQQAPPAGDGSVKVLASLQLQDDVQAGSAAAGALLAVPVVTREGKQGARFGRLIAIDLNGPSESWRIDLPQDLLNAPLLMTDGLVYFATHTADPLLASASLHAIDQQTGEQRWQWEPGMRALSAPVLVEEVLWTVGDGNQLWAVNARSGEAHASIELPGPRHILAPALSGDLLLVPTRSPLVIAIDIAQQRLAWQYELPNKAWSGTPVVVDDTAIVPFTDGSLVALDVEHGAVRWQTSGNDRGLPPVISNGRLLFVGERRGLRALDVSSGEQRWFMESERRIGASPLLYRTILIGAGHDHIVRGLDQESGEELWRWQGERRFETQPLFTPAGLVLIDAGGTLTLLSFPNPSVTVEEAISEQAWRVAATALAREGKFTEAAILMEEKDEPYVAGEMWRAAGEIERAIAQYEKDETERGWEIASKLHQQQGNWEASALALQRLSELVDTPEAWIRARQAYLDIGLKKESVACWREYCRLKRYPFVRIEVQPEAGFVEDQYNILKLVIANEGYGVARMLSARASGPFSGQDMQSQMMGNLAPNRTTELRLGLQPTSAGEVPLTLEISFLLGDTDQTHTITHRVFVNVASHEAMRQSSTDLGLQLSESFDVIDRDQFRRSDDELEELYRKQLATHKTNLEGWKLRKAEFGILAPPELDNLIDREERAVRELEDKLDRLHAEQTA